ncbi:MAG: Gfo/Idh/MocA family oxidoreductase [Acidimicrobiia bacterium]|nr:Gfo/Idh/MocA family oxidoreductase [Acidimicrobiia bacterium]
MGSNPVLGMMGRPLRLAVIGGAPGSFIGGMHRAAATMDGRFEIVASVLSSDPERSISTASDLGIPRPYESVLELLDTESKRSDGVEVVAIMTPNDSHHRYAVAALERGLDVVCDKPMTNTVDEALDIVRLVEKTGLVFCLTHNYTGYPMVRQARAMVEDGQLGEIRLVQVEYVQGGKADEQDPDPDGDVPWRFDPAKGGPSLVMGDIGTHAHNLIRFISGLEVAEVSAEIDHVVPGRRVDDFGAAMLRMDNGARGTFWVTQTAAGVENCLRIRVSGTKGSLEWWQENPTRLISSPLSAPATTFTPGGPGLLPAAVRASRIVAGHPEGFGEAFANLYSDAAEAIAARRSGEVADPLALQFPNHLDGAVGVRFIEAALASSSSGAAWTPVPPI